MNKKIGLDELICRQKFSSYPEEAEYVLGLINSGKISPVKSSGTNGKRPALYNRYWLCVEDEEDRGIPDEINFRLNPLISPDYYKKHTDVYKKERDFVLALSRWLDTHTNTEEEISVNERSFEIWGREKFLSGQKADGISAADVLKHCGISTEKLYVYSTAEPFAYYTHFREVPQDILILENLDPFYGIRKYLIEKANRLFGLTVGSLVYGGGKRIVKSFGDFALSAEPYLLNAGNRFFYAGDLDYEGIGIFESLAGKVRDRMEILPFSAYYLKMMEKALKIKAALPQMKEGQNMSGGKRFFSFFPADIADKMRSILADGYYIPQEILNISDYGVIGSPMTPMTRN